MKTKHLLAIGFSFCLFNTFAQQINTDSLVIDQIDIVKKYQYALKKVKKLDTQPQFSDSNFITSSFTYELPLVGNRESAPITTSVNQSFFNVESDSSKAPTYSNYLIGAFSTKANPFAEISFAEELKNMKFGVFGQYHADNQTNNEDPFFGFQHARFDGYLDYLKDDLLFQSELGFKNQEEKLVLADGARFDHQNISYQKYNAKIGVENLSKRSFIKHLFFEYKGLQEKNNNSENYIQFVLGLSDYLTQEGLLWRINFNYHLSVNEMDKNAFDNNLGLLDFTPQIQGDHDKLYYTLGLNTIVAWDDNHIGSSGSTYVIPEIALTYRFDKSFNLNAGLKADYELYNYINIQNTNPYLTESGLNTKTRVSKLVFANLDGIISGVKYQIGGQYSIGGNRLFYQTEAINSYVYEAYYETGDYMALSVNLDYQYTKNIALQLSATAQQYTLDSKSKASHTPGLVAHLKMIYQVNDKFATYATLNFATKQYMMSNSSFADPNIRSIQKTIDSRFDLSLGAHYDIKRQWRLFAEVNNIFNNKYELWGSYLHKGAYFTGGFRFKF